MRGYRRCRNCGEQAFNAEYRGHNLGILCAECNVDVRTSTVKRVQVPERIEQDRYAQLAARHGL